MIGATVLGILALLTAALAVAVHRLDVRAARRGRQDHSRSFEATQTELWRQAANPSSGIGTTGGG